MTYRNGFNNLYLTNEQWGGALSVFGENFGSDGKIVKKGYQYKTLGLKRQSGKINRCSSTPIY